MRAHLLALGLFICAPLVVASCAAKGQSAALRIHTPAEDSDAEVYVDGNYVGLVRSFSQRASGPLQLAPGVHRLEIRKPGRFPVQKTLRVDRDSPAEIVVDAELLEDPEP